MTISRYSSNIVKELPCVFYYKYNTFFHFSSPESLYQKSKKNTTNYTYCFDNPQYFSKCFKKHVGVLPVEYKKGKSSS